MEAAIYYECCENVLWFALNHVVMRSRLQLL